MTLHDTLGTLIRILDPQAVLPSEEGARFRLYRALVNTRPPAPISDGFLLLQDEFLREIARQKGTVSADELPPVEADDRLFLWQGDITRLAVDAIVNAANCQLLGCFVPCHACIDNVIHTYAGIQLREACAELMAEQGHDEPTGMAKITPAFNLPSNYVIHTVGPIVDGDLTAQHREQLAACYNSCLEHASTHGLHSIAFCCISTGVFRFPKLEAAEIAIQTVTDYLNQYDSPIEKVIFNVYEDADARIYRKLLFPHHT